MQLPEKYKENFDGFERRPFIWKQGTRNVEVQPCIFLAVCIRGCHDLYQSEVSHALSASSGTIYHRTSMSTIYTLIIKLNCLYLHTTIDNYTLKFVVLSILDVKLHVICNMFSYYIIKPNCPPTYHHR
jgi:hypothetical protein